MMWCRLYNETSSDPKFRYVAAQAGVTPAVVLGVWTVMLCHASAQKDDKRGTLAGFDCRIIAFDLGLEPAVLMRIRAAMEGLMLDGDSIIAWDKRQYESDSSRARTRSWRERKKSGDVTQSGGDVTDAVGDVSKRHVTACDASDTDTEKSRREEAYASPSAPRRAARSAVGADADFERFWKLYPRKIGKGAARKAWLSAVKRAEEGAMSILGGITVQTSLDRFDTREGGRFIPHPSTWLNGDRWLDGMEPDEDEPELARNRA